MDKYEYRIRAEEINALIDKKKFVEAVKIADTIDWRRVKSVMMLCKISELYKINRRYEDSKEILLLAYDRNPGSRKIVYSLCELSIKLEETVQAVEYYKEFVQIAPRDTGKFILQYRLYEAQDVSLEERIAVLEEYKKRDYREKWAYELAYLYHRIGLATRCVEECDELILWFGEGKYVIKAMELKMLHCPLTASQQEKYDRRFQTEEPVMEEHEESEKEQDTDESALPIEIKAVEPSNAPTAKIPSKNVEETLEEETAEEPEEKEEDVQSLPEDVEAVNEETTEEAEEEIPVTQPDDDLDIKVKTIDVDNEYSTINLQQELAKSLAKFMAEEDMVASDATMAMPFATLAEAATSDTIMGAITDDSIKNAIIAPLLQDTAELTPITEEDLLASMEENKESQPQEEAEEKPSMEDILTAPTIQIPEPVQKISAPVSTQISEEEKPDEITEQFVKALEEESMTTAPVGQKEPEEEPVQNIPTEAIQSVEEPVQNIPEEAIQLVEEPVQNIPEKAIQPVEELVQSIPEETAQPVEESVQNIPVEPVQLVEEPTQKTPAEPVQPEEEPIQKAPAEAIQPVEEPVQNIPIEPVQPVEEPVQNIPAEAVQPVEEPIQKTPVEPIQAVEEPVQNIPVEAVQPAQEPVQNIPEEAMQPVEEPVQNIPAEAIQPVEEPVQNIPEEAIQPVKEPVQNIPEEAMQPVEEPVQNIPAEAIQPVEEPVQNIPIEPVEEPIQKTPVEPIQLVEEPVQNIPVEPVQPAQEPVQNIPVEPVQPAQEPVQNIPAEAIQPVEEPVQNILAEPIRPAQEPVQNIPEEPIQPVEEPVQNIPVEPIRPAQEPVQNIPVEPIQPIEEPIQAAPPAAESRAEYSEPEEKPDDGQITGQLSLEDIMAEWEETKRANEERRMQEMRERVIQQTGPMFSNFDAMARASVQADLDLISPAEDVFNHDHLEEELKQKETKKASAEPAEEEIEEIEEIEEKASKKAEAKSSVTFDTAEIFGLEEKLLDALNNPEIKEQSAPIEPITIDSSFFEDAKEEASEAKPEVAEIAKEPVEKPLMQEEIAAFQRPSEISVPEPISAITESPAKVPAAEPAAAAPESPVEIPAAKPVAAAPESPAKVPAAESMAAAPESPAEIPITEPAATAIESPVEFSVAKPTVAAIESPAAAPVAEPITAATEIPAEIPISKPTVAAIESPAAAPAPKPITAAAESPIQIPIPEEVKPEQDILIGKPVDLKSTDVIQTFVPKMEPVERFLTKEEKGRFASFAPNKEEQGKVAKALDTMELSAATGNMLITGEHGTGTLQAAQNVVAQLKEKYPEFSGKMAKITGVLLAEKNIGATLENLENSALLIEQAGDLPADALGNLLFHLDRLREHKVFVIMEDTKNEIERLILLYPDIAIRFNARIDIQSLDNDGLVNYAREYAREQEYAIDDMGVLALYTKISDMQTNDHAVTVTEVKDMVDKAILHAQKKNVSHFMDIILAKRYDGEDMIILREKDFLN